MIWSLIVGGLIGWGAGAILGKDIPGGIIGNIIAGMLGSWVGGYFFKDFGPIIGGYAVIPSLIGAILIIMIASFILKKMNN
ncbi:GlsB/YeaQ/YmgE family stress response membrane protein [Atopobacter phocae]|uniref:GlsB/YeaQ/YmgE family stress response membrane protein n=1 Tax=Atopobacter phocae TaxID=136492 RepID=UPI00046FDA86|nr:GlsB/YeaQ/YmgE family stress response membrane protein [Atopobacter phocae]